MHYLLLIIMLTISIATLSNTDDPYTILDVSPQANLDEVRKAYYKQVLTFHPDKCTHLSPEERQRSANRFIEIVEAYHSILHKRSSPITIIIENTNHSSADQKLHDAARFKLYSFAQDAIKHGANVNSKDNQGRSVLEKAVNNSDLNIVRLLFNNGARIHHADYHLIRAAINNDDRALVNELLVHEAPLSNVNSNGVSVLLSPIINKNNDLIILLAKYGISLNYHDTKGETPLLYAIKFSDTLVLRTLLDLGASPSMTDKSGNPPLMWAARSGDIAKVQALIHYGASPTQPLPGNKNIFDLDLKPEIRAFLKEKSFSWLNPSTWWK